MNQNNKFMNPYLAGFLLGLIVIASYYFSGRGLGASGAIKSVVITGINAVDNNGITDNKFYKEYLDTHDKSPLKAWLVFLAAGVIIGGIISGARGGRLQLKLEHGPNMKPRMRIAMALIGGLLFGFGAQLGRGCTSGAALSGMSVLSTAGFVTMMAIFGTGFAVAWFFRKFWI